MPPRLVCVSARPAPDLPSPVLLWPVGAGGDAARGRTLLVSRDPAKCILGHAAPADLVKSGVRFSGHLAPSLDGAGARWTAGQLRLRIVDSRRLNPDTIMPSYYRIDGLV